MAGFIGFGFDYQLSTNGGASYASLGSIRDIGLPEHEGTKIDKSFIQQSNKWMLKRPGLIDPGESTFQLIFDKTTYPTILTNINVDGNNFKVVYSDLGVTASTETFGGFIRKVSRPVPMDGLFIITVTVTVSGIPTFTAGT
jgi:hypothetical protein